MASNPSLDLVQQLANRVTELYKIYIDKKKISDGVNSGVTLFPAWDGQQLTLVELQRQFDYHTTNGNTSNANFVKGYLDSAKAKFEIYKTNTNNAKSDYDLAVKDYQNLAESVLTPEQQAQSEILLQQNLDAVTPETETKSNKKVWFWVIGILVFLIILALIIYFIRKSKKKINE